MKIAVVVVTYNQPDALVAVLTAYADQSDLDFELVVADDGSTADTTEVVKRVAAHAPFALTHLWHEDRGFRAAVMRNRALAATKADYVIYTDGDCIPPRHFVGQHRRLAERGYFLSGNRALLSMNFTARVLNERLPVHTWGSLRWLAARVRGDINRSLPLVRLPDGAFRRCAPKRWKGVKTCNLSAWRNDLIAVNGFDESYAGRWGLEDSDLVIRLLHAGVKHKSARFAAPVFHLWHPEADKRGLAENRRLLEELIASKRIHAKVGVDQYL